MNHVIEPGKMPKLEDRKKMPYTDAVIHEIQRFANIVPMGVSRSTPTDVNFHGYVIPKVRFEASSLHCTRSLQLYLKQTRRKIQKSKDAVMGGLICEAMLCLGSRVAVINMHWTALLQLFESRITRELNSITLV